MLKKSQSGFSLIELLLVIVIIGIIAVLAVPGLLRAKRNSENENAYASMRTIISNEVSFYTTNGRYARLSELNTIKYGILGVTNGNSITRGNFTIDMNPAAPTDVELKSGFHITATKTTADDGVPYAIDVDEKGYLVEPYGNRHQ
ncbi:MAG: prepilin-type N-terminal cleavage/methylation domain-containing protein [Acidobacteriota bacterium]|nr:prepilin-type N-terminal cleavage/methylation domain-containing protein [Acidobacteriota bacterium]